jgi:hypothetical protein
MQSGAWAQAGEARLKEVLTGFHALSLRRGNTVQHGIGRRAAMLQ